MTAQYNAALKKINETGIVSQLYYPIVLVKGFKSPKPHEVVYFETGQIGEIFTVLKDGVEVLLFSKESVKMETKAARSGKVISIHVGRGLLEKAVDPLCHPLTSDYTVHTPEEERDIETEPQGIAARSRITKPLKTGVSVVDMLIPLGKGQRELIIGDRKTGKSSFLLTTLKNQIRHHTIIVYALIGKKKSDIKEIEGFLIDERLLPHTVLVATSSNDSPGLIYLTPYTAMTIAEYFKDQGHDVLVILDDLSTHAKFYRQISLLANNFPGRDSYPGDIFHTHAKLLERAGNFKHPTHGEVSITCLPVADTIEGDFTGYIATNLMSMTDGHIFFDSNLYYQGMRPAINVSISVTRVGKQIQTPVERSTNREITAFLSTYDKMQNVSHFGTELNDSIKAILANGEKIYAFFDQPSDMIIPPHVQLVFFAMMWSGFFNKSTLHISELRKKFVSSAHKKDTQQLLEELTTAETFDELLKRVEEKKEVLNSICEITQ